MITPKVGIKIPLLMLLAVSALSACASTGFQRKNHYTPTECKSLHGRGLISLEDRRKCQFGEEFEFKADKVQSESADSKKSAK
ncbi:MAG TPA: hypothetical protein DEA55_01765 [Rhodospirillaceae bacterium]|nr:hypothetical protein [Rhodospirillaceae bacterium]